MTARELALTVVRDVFPDTGSRAIERTAQAAFDYRARRAELSDRDRAFAAELAYGAIKMRRALDWHLEPFLGERRGELPPVVREILRLAAYELVYTRADEHATVFEFVNLAKRRSHRGLANLVNAVLRSLLRAGAASPLRESFASEEEYLGTRYSLPDWIARQWRDAFGTDAEAICAAVNEPPRSAVVVNTIAAAPSDAAARLAALGVETRPSAVVPDALLVERGPLWKSGGNGSWWTQSESSAMAVDVLGPQPGETILDVSSGRGNKALQIGARMGGDGQLTCIEGDERKAATLAQRLEEAGMVASVVVGDATTDLLATARFDRALVDAPCSGIGVLGRHPEARWKKRSTDGERLALTQRALLERTARHVYPGGALVYSVCSTDPRETTEVIDWFLARENFERGLIPAPYGAMLTRDGDVLVPPGIDGRDGFFIARVERRL